MDLDKLKESWKNQEVEKNTISSEDIYKMSHSKSSSVVKWILIIGILELIFWSAINFMVPQEYMDVYKGFHIDEILRFSTYVHYLVIIVFLILFYKNFNSISITDNTRRLMNRILTVRKTVKYYMFYNIGIIVASNIFVLSMMTGQPDELVKAMNPNGLNVEVSTLITGFIVATVILLLVTLGIIWVFYRATYGRLLKKLHKNYKELDNLEHLN